MEKLNHGDMRQHIKEVPSPKPQERGDAKRHKKTEDKFKTTTPKRAESPKILAEVVPPSTNTFQECKPVTIEKPNKINTDSSTDRSVDYRKRIKDRYTFRGYRELKKSEDISKFNGSIQYDVRNELPKQSPVDTTQKHKLKTPEIKQPERIRAKDLNNKAVSAIKMKPTTKSTPKNNVVENKKESPDTDKNKEVNETSKHRKPVIKTVTSKTDKARYKSITFVEENKPRLLQINIPREPKIKEPISSRIPKLVKPPVPQVQAVRSPVKRRFFNTGQAKRRVKKEIRKPLSPKSSLPETAEWAPESIDPQTKPYYEAWVNKTLTAMYSQKDKAYLEKSKILQAMKDIERRKTEEYGSCAELYAGRIRVRQRPSN